jgi:DNA invertase Pin-like site-specific DNA recombinase
MNSAMTSEGAPRRVAVYQRRAVSPSDPDRGSVCLSVEYCQQQFGEAPIVYNDDGLSGLNLGRPEFQKLMTDIAAGKIKTVVVREVSTLTREVFDLVWIHKQLKSHGVELHAVLSGGLISGQALLLNDIQAARSGIR